MARALLKNAAILILDEATAHLDARTERDVIDTVLAAYEGRTVLVFMHNPALLTRVDRVAALGVV